MSSASNSPTDPGSKPPHSEEELARVDDSIIEKAFKGSLIALAAILVGGGIVLWLTRTKKAAAPTQVTTLSAPQQATKAAESLPKLPFADITTAAGIRFSYNSGATGEKLLPETMGGGVAFLDYDNDGDQDLLFINGTWWEGKAPANAAPTTAALYSNNGKGAFTDVTAGSGLDIPIHGMGCAIGDYDNDGLEDVLITAVGGAVLFKNLGSGKFRNVTAEAGVGGEKSDWTTAATWFDIDNDGDLDLYVASYVKWSREIDYEVGYKLDGVNRAYGPPMNFQGAFPRLYRNNGKGTFTDISAASGVQVKNAATGVPAAKTLGLAPIDINRDGLIDLIAANDTTPNQVFTNAGNGTFVEIGQISGIAFDSYGNTRGAMGIDAGFYRNDSTLAVLIGNFANEMTALYTSQKDPSLFTDAAISEGIGPASRLLLKFGVFFFDCDLDGRLDVLSANGHLEEEISKIQKSQRYRQPIQLFWNTGSDSSAAYVPVTEEHAGSDLFKPLVGRGSAYADIDGDGDLDVVVVQASGPPLLLRNDQQAGNRWIRLKLEGRKSNRSAIGAWVRIKTSAGLLARQVMPTRSYLSQSELPVTIGLGKEAKVESIEVQWPGGERKSIPMPALNVETRVRE
ncbi:MAG: CRTAC1 family protein [Verrucomicrobia bacterium]|nr:CRTAC1 family protein [Verrucomicrobiota bacterium]